MPSKLSCLVVHADVDSVRLSRGHRERMLVRVALDGSEKASRKFTVLAFLCEARAGICRDRLEKTCLIDALIGSHSARPAINF